MRICSAHLLWVRGIMFEKRKLHRIRSGIWKRQYFGLVVCVYQKSKLIFDLLVRTEEIWCWWDSWKQFLYNNKLEKTLTIWQSWYNCKMNEWISKGAQYTWTSYLTILLFKKVKHYSNSPNRVRVLQ